MRKFRRHVRITATARWFGSLVPLPPKPQFGPPTWLEYVAIKAAIRSLEASAFFEKWPAPKIGASLRIRLPEGNSASVHE